MPTETIKELSRKVSETQTLQVVRADAGFEAKVIENPVQTHIRTAQRHASILHCSRRRRRRRFPTRWRSSSPTYSPGISTSCSTSAKGDRFTVVYEQIYQDGKYLRDGEVLAAEFVNSGKVYRAVRFVNDDGRAGYYTAGRQAHAQGLPARAGGIHPRELRCSIRTGCIRS